MTMPADVESPMYATASQEVRGSVAALGNEVADAGAVVGGAADSWSMERLISSGDFSEGGDNPLLSAPMLITPPA
jgi:hypothetical protein